ncbi:probable lysophospholipase BODYGUARD 1 [Oryza brachyantha]|uniref:probable lysophospholipase BODYGUARD 1 n=1 Tax=Oryza brachyantha TaxID=4533 RepID=UPI001ADAE494|nr:probable lysophospholipase BODYGUARD 1 [Oryza brachyantha]
MAADSDKKRPGSANGADRKASPTKPRSSATSGLMSTVFPIPFVLLLAVLYYQLQPPAPTTCGTPGGPPVTGPRVQLKDGRHLAYHEYGVPRDQARHKIIFVHGFDSCRYDVVQVSPELVEELGIYMLSFDRPGYGESDPHPSRTEDTIAFDIEELADSLQLGPKFYLIGYSMGGEIMWSCLKNIPHRLAGVSILGPVGNFWWSGFPSNVSTAAWYVQLPQDQWAVRVAHHAPWLAYWWNTQKMFPASSVISFNPAVLSREDMAAVPKFGYRTYAPQVRQQGQHESLHRDMMVGFGRWGWSPLEMENPFPGGEAAVHLWHGAEDLIVPVQLSRYIAQRLPWVRYHELPTAGHLFPIADGMPDVIVRSMLLGDE